MANKVVILRGPSGSGKSRYARNNYREALVVSADDEFMVLDPETGRDEYRFDPGKLGGAHARCFNRFLEALRNKAPLVVVDNTHIHHWEYYNYLDTAKMMGYDIEIVEFRPETLADMMECVRRNVHKVPFNVIARMCSEFEPCYKEKNVKRVPILGETCP